MKKKKKKKPRKTEVLKSTIDKITGKRTFNLNRFSPTGNIYIRLKQPGETITGFLGWPITNIQEATSYPIQLDSGVIVEIPGNYMMHKQIREGELCGQKVEIVFQGREYIHGFAGRYRKIYRIFKIEGEKTIPKAVWDRILKEVRAKQKAAVKPNEGEKKHGRR